MRRLITTLGLIVATSSGCATPEGGPPFSDASTSAAEPQPPESEPVPETTPVSLDADNDLDPTTLCSDGRLSREGVMKMLPLTQPGQEETIYTTFDRIDGIAELFEVCEDPWGMFPTTYRHITRRIIQAIETEEIEDTDWGRRIVVDFAGRYLAALESALIGEEPSYAWRQYYYLADQADVSRTRAVVVAMVAHLTLDPSLPPSWRSRPPRTTGMTLEDHGTTDTTITFVPDHSDKSWNNAWTIQQWWGTSCRAEIYTAFWSIDGVLATLTRPESERLSRPTATSASTPHGLSCRPTGLEWRTGNVEEYAESGD